MKRLISLLMIVTVLATASAVTAGPKGNIWHVPGDFATIQEAIDSDEVLDGDRIVVGPGNHEGAYVTKSVTIQGEGGAVINSGPMHPAGLSMGFRLLAGSDGAAFSHLTFEVDLAIMNGAAVNDVTVTHCTFNNTIQAVSNWSGNRWTISHNTITDLRTRNGGGIGILVADYTGGLVENNVVSHNTITGVLDVYANDGGGYNGSGIVLYADFRWGRAGAEAIRYNRVVQNSVSMVSDTPALVDIVAFELTDSRDDTSADPYPVIFDNDVGFNDFRGTALQIFLTPEELAGDNDISRNLGENRGQGLHPGLLGFGPADQDGITTTPSDGDSPTSDCTTIHDGTLTYSASHYLGDQPLMLGYDPYGYNYQAHMFNGSYANVYLGGYGYPPYEGDDEAYLTENPGAASTWCWPYRQVQLVMKWNDAWLSNMDCDADGKLDRHYGFASYVGSGAWETNHQWGTYVLDGNTCGWNYFGKIIAAPADANSVGGIWYASDGTEIGPVIWGDFAIIQDVTNDPCAGIHGLQYSSPDHSGFGGW